MTENNYPAGPHYPQDEIDLVDLWLVLVKHKGLFASVTAICIALAGIYAWIKPAQYDFKATLEVGGYWSQTGGNSFAGRFIPFEDTETVVAKIQDSYGLSARLEAIKIYDKDRVPSEIVAKSEKNSQTVQLQVTAPAADSDVAFNLLNEVSNHIIQDHAALLRDRQELLEKFYRERIETLNRQIKDLLQSRNAAIEKSSPDTKALIILMVDARLEELEREQSAIRQQLEVSLKADLKPTQLIFGPAQALKPAGPGPLLIILLGAIVGVILGMFAVMFQQLLDSARQRNRQ